MLGVRKLLRLMIYMMISLKTVSSNSDIWPLERPDGMPAIQSLEVMCGKDHMDVHLSFSQPFEGIVSSKGQHADPRCVYVPPSTGQTFFSFRIAYARCGTKPDMHGQFYENTVVVQYDKDLLEVWDEAKRLRCEWFNDYEKTASKPPMVIADLDVIQLDFRGDNVDCWMEIQHGKGPWAPPVSGIVPLGSTLTLVVAINDYRGNERAIKVKGEFDMRVKSCVASDGGGHTIQLSDEFGCVLRPKMISRFLKARGSDDRATVITYAFFHAFKFPDALSVHIKCKVEICRHGCLDHCQLSDNVDRIQERKDVNIRPLYSQTTTTTTTTTTSSSASHEEDGLMYDDIIQNNNNNNNDAMTSVGGQFLGVEKSAPKAQAQMMSNRVSMPGTETNSGTTSIDPQHLPPILEPARVTRYDGEERFPHGPRNLDEEEDTPRDDDATYHAKDKKESYDKKVTSTESQRRDELENPIRRKRSVIVSDRKVRSADVGVSGIYEVISEADLAFSPDAHAEAVTVFQGRIREEVVYGICLPVPGFSALFVIVALSAVISALVAGAMLHRLQVQREMMRENQKNNTIHQTNANGWLSYGLLRVRCSDRLHRNETQKPGNNPIEQG
ncbi:uncharacterized protein LOC122512887 isoform X1 [Leptopilina heterotoma]|uniref:uncharacterized protein LOC122512887 isoform X1 n=1 Tax=Leptopilina heterotoma TaxID=63436 RepID=UPI001CA89FAB|nr:uncharacterized protein LOC122512887 isoform X1 [Leptopilina heterotoma]